METEVRHDLIISGSGSASGGLYKKVKISGTGKINGDIDCVDFGCSGSGKIYGDITSTVTKISGSTKIEGSVNSGTVTISGHSDIDGNLSVEKIKISGSTDIKGTLTGEHVEIHGSATVGGNCETDLFSVEGSFTIDGLLNADTIDIRLHGRSVVKEIGGEKIQVKKAYKPFGLDKLFKVFGQKLTTEIIEGDDIYLEYTQAKVVRGNNVHIGQGCEIQLVEYKNDFQQVDDAKVKESKRI